MLATDRIFLATAELAQDPEICATARRELSELANSPEYRAWDGGGLSQRAPFELRSSVEAPVLSQLGLIQDGTLWAKLNQIGDRIFLTDGVWVDKSIRVFPFADESAAILAYCSRNGLLSWADVVVDLATGSGHNLSWFDTNTLAYGLDINPRALSYLHLNKTLNRCQSWFGVLNDIRDGITAAFESVGAKRILVLGNLPFGLAPAPGMLALTSDGGETGLILQLAAFEAVRQLQKERPGTFVRAILLGYSVGDAKQNTWEIGDLAASIFGKSKVKVEVLAEEGLLRIDGRRTMLNPAPIREALKAAGSCRLYHDNPESAQVLYSDLSERLMTKGFRDLAYLVVDVGG